MNLYIKLKIAAIGTLRTIRYVKHHETKLTVRFICFTENGKLYTFGSNDWGQLGHGSAVQFPSPKLVKRKCTV